MDACCLHPGFPGPTFSLKRTAAIHTATSARQSAAASPADPHRRPVVIAGAGFAAACAAIRLLALGFRPVLLRLPTARDIGGVEILPATAGEQLAALDLGDALARAGAFPAEGMDARWGRPDDGFRAVRSLHVERLALRREAIREAASRGAEIRNVAALPQPPITDGASVQCAGERFFAALDATGRRAAWSRPVIRLGRSCADIFVIAAPAVARMARVSRIRDGWAYAAGAGARATLGIVREAPRGGGSLPEDTWHTLSIGCPRPAQWLGRRPAFPQYASIPVRGRMLAIGDAAFAHNPVGGRGLSFALGSAFAAAATLASWCNRPADFSAAVHYYEHYVRAERDRHLAFLQAFAGNAEPGRPAQPARLIWWCGVVVRAPLAFPDGIREDRAIVLRNGRIVRWLGSFDLLALQPLCAEPQPPEAVIAILATAGLPGEEAALLLRWALEHGVLAGRVSPHAGVANLRSNDQAVRTAL